MCAGSRAYPHRRGPRAPPRCAVAMQHGCETPRGAGMVLDQGWDLALSDAKVAQDTVELARCLEMRELGAERAARTGIADRASETRLAAIAARLEYGFAPEAGAPWGHKTNVHVAAGPFPELGDGDPLPPEGIQAWV
jgi:hypothetical protein